MLETKLVRVIPNDYSHEERLINDYACFGWILTERSVVKKDYGGHVSDVEHNLTFKRDANIKNKAILDDLFWKYTIKSNEIKSASNSVKLPTKTYVISFLVCTFICALILFPTLYPVMIDMIWRPDEVTKILFAFLVLVLAACGGMLIGFIPIGIANGIKQDKAESSVKGRVYNEMTAIAREASRYL